MRLLLYTIIIEPKIPVVHSEHTELILEVVLALTDNFNLFRRTFNFSPF